MKSTSFHTLKGRQLNLFSSWCLRLNPEVLLVIFGHVLCLYSALWYEYSAFWFLFLRPSCFCPAKSFPCTSWDCHPSSLNDYHKAFKQRPQIYFSVSFSLCYIKNWQHLGVNEMSQFSIYKTYFCSSLYLVKLVCIPRKSQINCVCWLQV